MAIWRPMGRRNRRSKFYWGSYTDPNTGHRIRRSLKTTDKAAAETLLHEAMRNAALVKAGLADPYADEARRPLAEHIADWKVSLADKGNTPKHVRECVQMVTRAFEGCRFESWKDIIASTFSRWLADVRTNGLGATRANHYQRACKSFCGWMVRDRRAGFNSLEHLSSYNTSTDKRHERRALTDDELRALLAAAQAGPERGNMLGVDRAMMYRTAIETGFRANEIRGLTVGALDADESTLTVAAAYSKRRRDDVQPIRPEFAADLAAYVAGRKPSEPIFAMPHPNRLAIVLRADLRVSSTPYRDDAGRVLDFHALRHTFITNLARAGVHPKHAQELARHSTITLTMDRYSHVARGELSAALEGLPDVHDRPATDQLRATGTCDDAPARMSKACHKPVREGVRLSAIGQVATKGGAQDDNRFALQKQGFAGTEAGKKRKAAVGFEPTNSGFAIRPLGPLGHAASVGPVCPRENCSVIDPRSFVASGAESGVGCRTGALAMKADPPGIDRSSVDSMRSLRPVKGPIQGG